jgi:hypothetical protein
MTAREFFTFAELLRRVDATIEYLRSFFDDPVADGKGSMARLCAAGALLAGAGTVVMTFRYAFAALVAKSSEATTVGILAGMATMLLGTVCFGLLRRTTASGVTETIDDQPAPTGAVKTEMTVKTETAP